MISWIYLFVAALLEVLWTYSLKFMDLKKIKSIAWNEFFNNSQNIATLLPLLGYIVFGIGNVIFFSLAMKNIPASIAFAAWMAFSLIGIKLADIFFFKETYSYSQFFYFACILIGIIGLKRGI